MPWNLQRVLFWLSMLGGVFVALSILNHVWALNPKASAGRQLIGDTVFAAKFFFSIGAYFLIRHGNVRAGIAVIAVWICSSLAYAAGVMMLEPLSGLTVSIFLAELFISGLLVYYSVLEAKSYAWFRAPRPPAA